jgi:hypothetical protein
MSRQPRRSSSKRCALSISRCVVVTRIWSSISNRLHPPLELRAVARLRQEVVGPEPQAA